MSGHVRSSSLAFVLALVATSPAVAVAQGGLGRAREIGLDAGAVVGLGDQSSVRIDVPAARARLGFFLPNSRWSVEPALGLSYFNTEGSDGVLLYNLEGGLLYHFQPPLALRDETLPTGGSVYYFRPFMNVTGYTGDNGDSEVSLGAGLGVKVPWRPDLAWRLEANGGYGFDNEAFRIGAFVGLSFFPH